MSTQPVQDQNQKRDAGKVVISLVWDGYRALVAMARVLEFGQWKYKGRCGWQKVDNAVARYADALGRHYGDFIEHGPAHLDICPKHEGVRPKECTDCSGLPTIAHLFCDAMFLTWFTVTKDPGRPWI